VSARPVIDLNADLGEGFGPWRMTDDHGLLRVVTSANVACGFHAGDARTMLAVTAEAAERGVAVGAHVAYRDLAGFGRRAMAVGAEELASDVIYQLGALAACCAVAGTRVRYVKPHGALYNTVVADEEQAAAVVEAVRRFDASLAILGLPGSALLRLAGEAGLAAVPEGFADRAYTGAGTLVSRSHAGAVLAEPDAVAERSVRLATSGEVVSLDGAVVPMPVRSLCVHGDEPGAVELAARVRRDLEAAGVQLASFA
jgi:UPF0271 protein